MAKRKRQQAPAADIPAAAEKTQNKKAKATSEPTPSSNPTTAKATSGSSHLQPETIQIIVGSYDQVLHGLTATLHESPECQFADTFLFNAHSSAIRCVAVSPPSAKTPGQGQKVLLATGSTDERIHVYNLSAHPPPPTHHRDKEGRVAALLAGAAAAAAQPSRRSVLENPKNRELGTLLHHSSTVTALRFPTRAKLLSSGEDSSIAVTRSRDWSVLTTVKAPIPKAQGRPSGDTAPFGGAPSGVNDFAIHPSMKLMISVSKGERCMRLWNLVTGKKAGVLGFTRSMLVQAGEGRHASGEGRKVVWGPSADGGDADEFAVAFERDVVVFGMDSVPKCRAVPVRTKVHQVAYFTLQGGDEGEEQGSGGGGGSVMAVSTEDGRVLFLSTRDEDLVKGDGDAGQGDGGAADEDEGKLPLAKLLGYVGGKDAGVTSRVKDFAVLRSGLNAGLLYVAGASSDGKVRVWTVTDEALLRARDGGAPAGGPLGALAGVYETHNRITCLAGFVMLPRPDDAGASEEDIDEDESESEDSESESD